MVARILRVAALVAFAALSPALAAAQTVTSMIPANAGDLTVECDGRGSCRSDEHYLFAGVTFQAWDGDNSDMGRLAGQAAGFGALVRGSQQSDDEEARYLWLLDGSKAAALFTFLCGLPDNQNLTSDIEIRMLPEKYRFASLEEQKSNLDRVNLNMIKRLGGARCHYVN